MKETAYKKIYDDLKSRIGSGGLPSGSRMETEPVLASGYQVSVGTVRKALDLLVEEGIVSRQQGRGTYVNKGLSVEPAGGRPGLAMAPKAEMTIAYGMSFHGQNVIGQLLFEGADNLAEATLPPDPGGWAGAFLANGHDLAQVSAAQLQLDEVEGLFEPFPERLKARAQAVFEEKVLDEHSNVMGDVLALPLCANMSMLYANEKLLGAGGTPPESLSLEDFTGFCAALKKRCEFPLLFCPAPGLLYEPFLEACGGGYFDKAGEFALELEPFARMIEFLRKLHVDKLAVNADKIGMSYPRFVRREKVRMVLHNPLFNHLAGDEAGDWRALPWLHDRRPGGTFTTVGIGVGRFSKNKRQAWSLMERLLETGLERLAANPMQFPARKDLQANWKGARVKGADAFPANLRDAPPLPSRRGFWRWFGDVYFLFEQAAEGKLGTREAWRRAGEAISRHMNVGRTWEQEAI